MLFGLMVFGGRGVSRSSVPTEDMARKWLESRYGSDEARILSFRKTDGTSMEVHGVKMYKMQCEVEVEFLLMHWQSNATFSTNANDVPIGGKGKKLKYKIEVRP